MSIASAHELATHAHQGINGLTTAYEISKVDMVFHVLVIILAIFGHFIRVELLERGGTAVFSSDTFSNWSTSTIEHERGRGKVLEPVMYSSS